MDKPNGAQEKAKLMDIREFMEGLARTWGGATASRTPLLFRTALAETTVLTPASLTFIN